ncbi:MAG: ASCH domain-containing protein [Candidatus Sphingomonas colombiensis]|nr:ASCH domain-containing protein [Sphingomonas sp.]WEK43629.1 MAG: ASCH domain-containing protein [Sphingomonas sp.]
MKALTIWQPWASLIIAGAKPYEFRGWRFPRSLIGQRVVIHAAAKKIDRDELNALLTVLALRDRSEDIALAAAETCLIPDLAVPILNAALEGGLPMAAGIGTAVLGEPRIGTEIAADFGVPRANDSNRDEHANWGWPMLDIEVWPEPVPMRGAQGFWNWPQPGDALL